MAGRKRIGEEGHSLKRKCRKEVREGGREGGKEGQIETGSINIIVKLQDV